MKFLRWKALIWILVFWGCQTTKTIEQHPPAFVNPYFTICQDKEGYVSAAWFERQDLKGSGEMFWVSGKPEFWSVELINPLGQPVAEIALRERQFAVTGALREFGDLVSMRADGYLELDGHFFPLKAQEIPCLLNFKMPLGWSQQLTSLNISAKRVTMSKSEADREVDIIFERDESGAVREFCSQITWSRFWGLRTYHWEWCADYSRNLEGQLKFEDYILRLVYLDN